MEPDKCEGWQWVTWTELKAKKESGEKLFQPLATLLDDYTLEELQR